MNFSQPVWMHDLEGVDPLKFLYVVITYCNSGRPMHRDALKSVVLKLTQLSRDLDLEQDDRDAAADLATSLANAALKAYGPGSEFGCSLKSGIESIVNGT